MAQPIGVDEFAPSGLVFYDSSNDEMGEELDLYTSPDFGKLRSCNFPKSGDKSVQGKVLCLIPAHLVQVTCAKLHIPSFAEGVEYGL